MDNENLKETQTEEFENSENAEKKSVKKMFQKVPADFDELVKTFSFEAGIKFSNKFGSWIKDLNLRTNNRFKLLGKIKNVTKYNSFQEYFAAYSNSFATYPVTVPASTVPTIVENIVFWKECGTKFSEEELAVIIIARLIKIQTCVLYKKDIAPESDTDVRMTTISSNMGKFSNEVIYKK